MFGNSLCLGFLVGKYYIETIYSHTPLYTSCIGKRQDEMKEKVCLCGVYMATCPIFVWVSKSVLTLKDVYLSLLFSSHVETLFILLFI